MTGPPYPKRQAGFSLLEVLVAFSILALSLGVLMQIFSSGVRSATLNEEYIKAAMLADARLQAVGVGQTLQEGLFEGVEDDRYHWRVEVSPYVDEALPAGGNSASAFHVKVAVWWEDAGRTRRVELNSMRLGQP